MKEGAIKFSSLSVGDLFMHQPEGALCIKTGDTEYRAQWDDDRRRKIEESAEVYDATGYYFITLTKRNNSP